MILYFNQPNVKFISSIIEYDLIKKLPPEYTLNLLTTDKNKQIKDIKEKEDNKSIFNVNNIQRELLNLLSNDLDNISEKDDEKAVEFENNLKNPEQKDNNENPSMIKDSIINNNSYFNNRIDNNNLLKINNSMNFNMNNPGKEISNLNNNLNDNIDANIGSNMGTNIKYTINNNCNNHINYNINDKISNNLNNPYINFNNNNYFMNWNNNPYSININKSINNVNNNNNNSNQRELFFNIGNVKNINDNFNYNNLYKQNINFLSKNNTEQNIGNVSYILQNNNIDPYSINNNNDIDNINKSINHNINNVNRIMFNNLQNMANKNNINNTENLNNIQNINYFNNINYINNMNNFGEMNHINNMFNINNVSNNINYSHKNKANNIKDSKYSSMSLLEITNKLDLIAKKQPGCRFLENLIKTNNNRFEIINKIFYPKLYWVKLYELSNDLFGNYFIQTIIPLLDNNNLVSFTNLVNNNLLKLCLNPHGTRVVQVLIENIKNNKNLLVLFTNCLSKIMGKLINDLNGSFVLMHFAKEVKDNEIIYDFLNNNIIDISIKSYSCSALQKFIDIGTNTQKMRILNNIVNNANSLIGNQCGLYVLQFVMDKKNYYINDKILEKFINNIIKLSKQKYSSNVIEKCLETCSPEMVKQLIDIFSKEIVVRDLIKDIFGNYVIQKTLIVCEDDIIKTHLLNIISSEFGSLSNLPFGHKLIKKLAMTYPEIKNKI